MKTKFEIVLELYKKEQITAEECKTLMEKETVFLGYPSFYQPYSQPYYKQLDFIRSPDPYYYSTTGDNSNSVINDKPEI